MIIGRVVHLKEEKGKAHFYSMTYANSQSNSKYHSKTLNQTIESKSIDICNDRRVARLFVSRDSLDFEVTGLKNTPQSHNPGVPTEQGYYQKLSKAFKQSNHGTLNRSITLTMDCANGVGAPKAIPPP
ncbi:hypothetical protein PPACK8108_LOCUS22449 [Phakopsora pachyrhizi]|uniref:Uncharacterized protein n=1 Tax=Phakopsora pachyrhizi TaxID=170000 RepID=A0AAV0BPX2_PHAPC|nr:hypothetical protein PPACK8108_LOCUS22449 [Phakopsora pachyrhizi]